MNGWWYYYLIAVAVKVPLTFWLLVAARLALMKRRPPEVPSQDFNDRCSPSFFSSTMVITAVGSSRNYGCALPSPISRRWRLYGSRPSAEQCRALVGTLQIAVLARCAVFSGHRGVRHSRSQQSIPMSSPTSMPWQVAHEVGAEFWQTPISTGDKASSRSPVCSRSTRILERDALLLRRHGAGALRCVRCSAT